MKKKMSNRRFMSIWIHTLSRYGTYVVRTVRPSDGSVYGTVRTS